MTIPAASRGKPRHTTVHDALDEIQVDTVPNPEPMGLSAESRYNYFFMMIDRFSCTFRICGIQDKSSEACIDATELIISQLNSTSRRIKSI